MKSRRAVRIIGLAAGGCLLAAVVATASFCVAFRAERRTNLVSVPDWTGKPRADAQAEAASLGLVTQVVAERHDPAVAAGGVVQQEPAAGAVVRRGRTIRVTVSLGGETMSVPDVVRHPAREAEAQIRRQGLTPGVETRIHDAEVQDGQVVAQAPLPGTLSVAGEQVRLLVSEGARPPRWVMPSLGGRPLRDVQDWITLCGFRPGPVSRVPADGTGPGTVVGQQPLPGSPIGPRDVVVLTVAR